MTSPELKKNTSEHKRSMMTQTCPIQTQSISEPALNIALELCKLHCQFRVNILAVQPVLPLLNHFFVLQYMLVNKIFLFSGLLIGLNNQIDDKTVGFGQLCWTFFTIFLYFIEKKQNKEVHRPKSIGYFVFIGKH